MKWWVYVPGRRLALPADVPRLGLDDVIGRRWHLEQRRDRYPRTWLLLPNPEDDRYLKTYPLGWRWNSADGLTWYPHDPRPLVVTMTPQLP